MDALTHGDIGQFEVRTANSTYLVETPIVGETWVTRFRGTGDYDHGLRRDGDRLRCISLTAVQGARMPMTLLEVADYPGYAGTFRDTSPVTEILRIT